MSWRSALAAFEQGEMRLSVQLFATSFLLVFIFGAATLLICANGSRHACGGCEGNHR